MVHLIFLLVCLGIVCALDSEEITPLNRHLVGILCNFNFSIEDEGQTALGAALLMSVQLAKRAPGSKVLHTNINFVCMYTLRIFVSVGYTLY